MQVASINPPPVRPSPPSATAATDVSTAVTVSNTSAPRVLNPDMHLDPGLGIVVTEYFNSHGDLTQQFPTEKAIQRYQVFGLPCGNSGT